MVKFIVNLYKTLLTIINIVDSGFKGDPIKSQGLNRSINLIVNGPSSSVIMDKLGKDTRFTQAASVVVNFFANNKEYELLKPEYYILSDPMFFQDTPGKNIQKVKSFYQELNRKTTWPLIVYIPKHFGKERFFSYSGIDNNNITPVEINCVGYDGFESLRNYCYMKGYCSPRPYTVAIMALYACVQMGFQQIDVYGLDNNYYKSLCLDEEGRACDVIQHNGEPDEYRILLDSNGKPYSLCNYLLGLTYHLKNHEYMEKYAEYKGVKIFNHSPITMVDAYPRKLEWK